MPKNSINLPLTVFQDGKAWELFSFEFETVDGKFSSYFYALSHEHASYILEEMRGSAGEIGRLAGVTHG